MKFSWVKCSEVLSNRVPTIIRLYIDHMKFAAYMAYCFITFFHIFGSIFISIYIYIYIYIYMYGCMFCMFLFNFVKYVFLCYVYVFWLLYVCLCILNVMYVLFCVFCFIALFCVLFVCKCVLYYCHRVSTQLWLTKYIIYPNKVRVLSKYQPQTDVN
jgi:hypothetical protein